MIKSPKEKFQSSQVRTGQWAQIVANPIFDEVCDTALLQIQCEMYPMPASPQHSADSFQQLAGASRLIRILKTIHETTQEPKNQTAKGLNYQAGV